MRPKELVLRCFAEERGNVWQAFCIDFGLAVQGESLAEVKRKLDEQVRSYLYDALVGEDREHASDLLLHRKAPLYLRMRYWWYRLVSRFHGPNGDGRIFGEPLPLSPAT
jgi:hypothetical protein